MSNDSFDRYESDLGDSIGTLDELPPALPGTAIDVDARSLEDIYRARAQYARDIRRHLGLPTNDLPELMTENWMQKKSRGRPKGGRPQNVGGRPPRPQKRTDGVTYLFCTKCKEWMPAVLFYKRNDNYGGHSPHCKKCYTLYRQERKNAQPHQ